MSLLLKSSRLLARNIETLSKCVSIGGLRNKTILQENQIKSYSSQTLFNTNNRLHILHKQNVQVRDKNARNNDFFRGTKHYFYFNNCNLAQ